MKAILINPYIQEVTEVEYNGDFLQINRLIGISEDCFFDAVGINGTDGGEAIYFDDGGLFVEHAKQRYFYLSIEGEHPLLLAGKALVLGYDKDGEPVSPTETVEQIRNRTIFPNHEDAVAHAKLILLDEAEAQNIH